MTNCALRNCIFSVSCNISFLVFATLKVLMLVMSHFRCLNQERAQMIWCAKVILHRELITTKRSMAFAYYQKYKSMLHFAVSNLCQHQFLSRNCFFYRFSIVMKSCLTKRQETSTQLLTRSETLILKFGSHWTSCINTSLTGKCYSSIYV